CRTENIAHKRYKILYTRLFIFQFPQIRYRFINDPQQFVNVLRLLHVPEHRKQNPDTGFSFYYFICIVYYIVDQIIIIRGKLTNAWREFFVSFYHAAKRTLNIPPACSMIDNQWND